MATTEITHKASKETWPEKNQLRVEKKHTNRQNKCCTRDNELHNLIRGTPADTTGDTKEYACIWNFWTIAPRGDEKKKHSSGTSGPIASRDDGAIFLTRVKSNKGCVRRGFLHLIPTPG